MIQVIGHVSGYWSPVVKNFPVASVAIGGAVNAGILAAEILAGSSPELGKKLEDYRARLRAKVEEADAGLQGDA